MLTRAQLPTLKMQLQPHFLFNTLNAIMVLVRQQRGRQAEDTLGLLGDLLRSVDDVDAQEVPLSRELHGLELYLSIRAGAISRPSAHRPPPIPPLSMRQCPTRACSRSSRMPSVTALAAVGGGPDPDCGDDEPLAREGLRLWLSQDSEVGAIQEARASIRQSRPDLVLLDVQMPELAGFEVVREIGADRR